MLLAAVAGAAGDCRPAQADLQLCNRMSYVTEAALALEENGKVETRGWVRVDPGQCRLALQGAPATQLYLHVRVPDLYGPSPLPQTGHADFCVGNVDFIIAGAQKCTRANQALARFTAINPSEGPQGPRVYLAEEAEYTDEQARDAGIQRLLVIAGYDASPVDGIRGAKTEAVIAQFLTDSKLGTAAAARSDFFDLLLQAAQKPGLGLTWCNETAHPVMAALGADERGAIVTRGWYRIAPGKCLRPEIKGQPARLYSFGEAVDAQGKPVRDGDKSLSWGGDTVMCTRNFKFELDDHADCAAKGLSAAGFAPVALVRGSAIVRFK